jgi:putative tricarboxylic transport membrane protein
MSKVLGDYRDALVGLFLLAFAGLYWLGANAIRVSPLEGGVGAAGLPKALAYVLAGLSVYLIVRNFAQLRSGLSEEDEGKHAEAADQSPMRQHLSAALMFVFGCLYLLLLPYIGYPVGVALLMAATAYFLGLRQLPKLLAFAICGSAFFYLLFVVILKIPLPNGLIFERLYG